MTSTQPVTPLIEEIKIINEEIVQDGLLEMAFYEGEERVIDSLYNPYDYQAIQLVLTIITPSSNEIQVRAFWYRPYESLALIGGTIDEQGFYQGGQEMVRWEPGGFNHYRARYRVKESGLHSYTLKVIIAQEVVQETTGSFEAEVAMSPSKGLIQVDPVNKKNFVFQDGSFYSPNGVNLGWWSSTKASHDYANWFMFLNQNNGNYARIWMANWSFSLHKDSYSNFDTRQSIAIRLDHVFSLAEQHDIYIMLTLLNHGQFSAVTNPEWSENVYNKARGGMLDFPIQFFYNAEAKQWYQNELLYIISRYGHSENLFSWELFNEVDWIDGYSAIAVTQWHSEMATFLKNNDPYVHMVSTSYKYTFGTAAYSLASIDFGAVHSYGYYDVHFYQKLLGEIDTLWNRYQKPMFFGEIGIDWQSGQSSYHTDFTGVTIRQGAWGGIMASAGGAHHWWWDSWFERYNMWPMLKGAGAYLKEMDLALNNHSYLHKDSTVISSHTDAKIMGYRSKGSIYGYVYHNQWNYWNRTPSVLEHVQFQIELPNGEYTLRVFDTVTGEILSTSQVSVMNYAWTITIPTLQEDFAFILNPTE